jgi:hypothetical protein
MSRMKYVRSHTNGGVVSISRSTDSTLRICAMMTDHEHERHNIMPVALAPGWTAMSVIMVKTGCLAPVSVWPRRSDDLGETTDIWRNTMKANVQCSLTRLLPRLLILMVFTVIASGCATNNLHRAIANGQEDRAIELIKQGKGVEDRTAGGTTPLHEAVWRNQERVVRALLDARVDVNARMPDGTTPVMLVWRFGNHDMLRMLTSAGADLRARTRTDMTVLHSAFRGITSNQFYERSKTIATAMIQSGAPIDLGTPLSPAPASYAWGTMFLAERASNSDRFAAARHYESAKALFDDLAQREWANHAHFTQRAKGAFARNIGRAVTRGVVAGALGVVPVGTTQQESRRGLLLQADAAKARAEMYEAASKRCERAMASLTGY